MVSIIVFYLDSLECHTNTNSLSHTCARAHTHTLTHYTFGINSLGVCVCVSMLASVCFEDGGASIKKPR